MLLCKVDSQDVGPCVVLSTVEVSVVEGWLHFFLHYSSSSNLFVHVLWACLVEVVKNAIVRMLLFLF